MPVLPSMLSTDPGAPPPLSSYATRFAGEEAMAKAPEYMTMDSKVPSPPMQTRTPKVTYFWTQRGIDELKAQGCFDEYGQPFVGGEVPEVLTSEVKQSMLHHGNCSLEQKANSFSDASSFTTMTDPFTDSSIFVMPHQPKPFGSVPEHPNLEEQSEVTPRLSPTSHKADMGRLLLTVSLENHAEIKDVQNTEKKPESEEGGGWTIGWGVIGLMLLPLLL